MFKKLKKKKECLWLSLSEDQQSHSSSNRKEAQAMAWNEKVGQDGRVPSFSHTPDDTGGYRETLRKGISQKRGVLARRTRRPCVLGLKCNQDAGRVDRGKEGCGVWMESHFSRMWSWLWAVARLGLTFGRLTGVLGLVLGFLIKSLWSRGSKWYFMASMRKSLQVLLFFIKASSSTVWR